MLLDISQMIFSQGLLSVHLPKVKMHSDVSHCLVGIFEKEAWMLYINSRRDVFRSPFLQY